MPPVFFLSTPPRHLLGLVFTSTSISTHMERLALLASTTSHTKYA